MQVPCIYKALGARCTYQRQARARSSEQAPSLSLPLGGHLQLVNNTTTTIVGHISRSSSNHTTVPTMALAPSSPRLPSPPPPAEIQISPNSPSGGAPASPHATQMEQSVLDANSRRRIHPGTKAADMAAGPPLVPLSEVRSIVALFTQICCNPSLTSSLSPA